MFIPTLQMGDPVTLSDPLIGDDLVITPLYNPGEGIPFARDFVEFSLLETAQGVVVAKKADAVSVLPLRNGLRISPAIYSLSRRTFTPRVLSESGY